MASSRRPQLGPGLGLRVNPNPNLRVNLTLALTLTQICINLANERLHSLFLSYVFHGLPPSQLKILLRGDPGRIDNTQCVEMLCATPVGVLHLLDFQCKAPRATEASFCLAVNQTHGASQFLRTPKVSKAQGVTANENTGFFVRHFAGDPYPSPSPYPYPYP